MKEGGIVEEWLDVWGLVVGNKVGEEMRRGEKEGMRSTVLDLGIGGGGIELEVRGGDRGVGLDHRPLEVEVKVLGWEVDREMEKRSDVDWVKFESEVRIWGEGRWEEGREILSRRDLDGLVEELEDRLKNCLERCKGRRKWYGGRKKWWDEEIEVKRKEVVGLENRWRREGGEERKRDWSIMKGEYKELVQRKKGDYWLRFLEGWSLIDLFRFVKTDRDFLVDIPDIKGDGGIMVTGDEEKGVAILRGLGKREELGQEKDGFRERVVLEEEFVEECLWK